MWSLLRPRLIIVAGPNGAGKTSSTEAALRHEWMQGCVSINPDNIARDEFGDWNSPTAIVRAESRRRATRGVPTRWHRSGIRNRVVG